MRHIYLKPTSCKELKHVMRFVKVQLSYYFENNFLNVAVFFLVLCFVISREKIIILHRQKFRICKDIFYDTLYRNRQRNIDTDSAGIGSEHTGMGSGWHKEFKSVPIDTTALMERLMRNFYLISPVINIFQFQHWTQNAITTGLYG